MGLLVIAELLLTRVLDDPRIVFLTGVGGDSRILLSTMVVGDSRIVFCQGWVQLQTIKTA